jgi:hypothetical protein
LSLIQWRSLSDDEPRPELPLMPLSPDSGFLDEPCHEFDDELLGFEEDDDPRSLDPLVRPEELPRPSDCPILLPTSLFTLSRLRLSMYNLPFVWLCPVLAGPDK